MTTGIFKYLGIPATAKMEKLHIAIDAESISAMGAPAIMTAHNPYWRKAFTGETC